jgi:hypothetical protein
MRGIRRGDRPGECPGEAGDHQQERQESPPAAAGPAGLRQPGRLLRPGLQQR